METAREILERNFKRKYGLICIIAEGYGFFIHWVRRENCIKTIDGFERDNISFRGYKEDDDGNFRLIFADFEISIVYQLDEWERGMFYWEEKEPSD